MAWRVLAVCGVLAATPGLLRGDGSTPTAVTLGLLWPQGASFKVEQRLELDNTNRGETSFAGGAGRSAMVVKGHVAIVEEWSDKVTAAAEGQPTEVQRAWKSSKLRAQKRAAVATSLQGASVVLTPTATGAEVKVAKGRPDALAQKLLGTSPIDPVALLLPRKPLAVGDTWEISVEALTAFQRSICIGCAAADGPAAEDVGVLRMQLENGSATAIGKLVIGTLASLKDGVATLTFRDDKTHDSDAPIKGPLFDVPATRTSIEGTLTFQVATGRPQRLEWTLLHWSDDFTPPPSIGGPTVPGFKENWLLVKTWK